MPMNFGDALEERAAYSAEDKCSAVAFQNFFSIPMYFEGYLENLKLVWAREKNGGQGRNGLASLALRAHYVGLSALRASDEPPTRGFSER